MKLICLGLVIQLRMWKISLLEKMTVTRSQDLDHLPYPSALPHHLPVNLTSEKKRELRKKRNLKEKARVRKRKKRTTLTLKCGERKN
jgi:hypothetical protein